MAIAGDMKAALVENDGCRRVIQVIAASTARVGLATLSINIVNSRD